VKNVIVTTTINKPTIAIKSYDALSDWDLIVVGDTKTPNYKLEQGRYISWEEQMDIYRPFCDLIGACSVARGRMIAFIEGYKHGGEIIASIDDDNFPLEHWGKDIILNKEMEINMYETNLNNLCFNPLEIYYLQVPTFPTELLTHRGFPYQLKSSSSFSYGYRFTSSICKIVPLIREDLWFGDPDIDAVDRISKSPFIDYFEQKTKLFTGKFKFTPVNTQNTFIHRSIVKDFPANIPFIGRADDIWASYLFQAKHPNSVIYGTPSVIHYQDRTYESSISDLENEIFAYKNTYNFLRSLQDEGIEATKKKFLPIKSIEAIELYESYFEGEV